MSTAADALEAWLATVPHTAYDHAPVASAEDAAAQRGTALHEGVKALVMKIGRVFMVVALPADRALDGRSLRKAVGVQRYRFARAEELAERTGLVPGSVPPIGHLFDLPLVLDEAVLQNDHVVFTLARPDRSARVATADFLTLARPDTIAPLTEPAPCSPSS